MSEVWFGTSDNGDSLNNNEAVSSQSYFWLLPLLPVVAMSGFFATHADFPDLTSELGTWATFLGTSYVSAKAAGIPI